MPRSFDISLSSGKADVLLEALSKLDGVVGIARQRDAGIEPRGDILSVQMTNDATRQVIDLLAKHDVLDGGSIVSSAPRSMISPKHQDQINRESNETSWDEMAFLLRQDTNIAVNYLTLMALAGAVASAGLWSDTLHVVIGSMVIAPAFEPLVRISFGFLAGPRSVSFSGLAAAVAGYLSLAAGALLAMFILTAVDPAASTNLETRGWVQFWSTITPAGLVTSMFAAAAGAVVISAQRSVLTTGVMVALALVPSMAVAAMAVGVGDLSLAARGLARWGADVALVIGISALVLVVKRMYPHRHRALS